MKKSQILILFLIIFIGIFESSAEGILNDNTERQTLMNKNINNRALRYNLDENAVNLKFNEIKNVFRQKCLI
jgi:hypothetical protein